MIPSKPFMDIIGLSVSIIAGNHRYQDEILLICLLCEERKSVIIEDTCLICDPVVILDGASIGYGSVIGAGTVVIKDIPAYSIAVGNPAYMINSERYNSRKSLHD